MLCKLALRNVARSIRDFAVYFLTLAFGVCLFYVFNSIDAQQAMIALSESQKYYVEQMIVIMGYVSVFVAVVFGLLVVYANRFLMRRRKKEFGIYSVLGMTKREIGKILIKETILFGVASLIFGILLGILASQGLTMITGKIAGMAVSAYPFVFSVKAVGAAVVFFGITFFCVHLFNVREMRKWNCWICSMRIEKMRRYKRERNSLGWQEFWGCF